MGTKKSAAVKEEPAAIEATPGPEADNAVCVELQKYLTMVSPGKEQWNKVLDAMQAGGYEFDRKIAGGEW